ncbi:MAG: hypothetical protein GY730_07000 [bacterium]|nr:hypothetical protein [bacterium]
MNKNLNASFEKAIRELDELILKKRPTYIQAVWIKQHAPHCYWHIINNYRMPFGTVNWDKVTRALNKEHQKLWKPRYRKTKKVYFCSKKLKKALNIYNKNLYLFFIIPTKQESRCMDCICITLVRLVQRGNLAAKKKLEELLYFTVENWIETIYSLKIWQGYEAELREHIEKCIHRFRYAGSFLGYLFKTLIYVGRGLIPRFVYSLDDFVQTTNLRHIDLVCKNIETNEIKIFSDIN